MLTGGCKKLQDRQTGGILESQLTPHNVWQLIDRKPSVTHHASARSFPKASDPFLPAPRKYDYLKQDFTQRLQLRRCIRPTGSPALGSGDRASAAPSEELPPRSFSQAHLNPTETKKKLPHYLTFAAFEAAG